MFGTTFYDPGELIDGDLRLVLVEKAPADTLRGLAPAYKFDMVAAVAGYKMGDIDLRLGDSDFLQRYAGQVGYGVQPAFRGHRYAARSLRLLIPLARRHELLPLWVTVNPDNWASRRTCELAGAQFVEIVDVPADCDMYARGERQKCRYRLDV